MRRGFVPLVIIIVLAVLAVVGFTFVRSFQRGIPNPEDKVFMEEFEKVEIAQLVADPKAWDGKKVEVTGAFYSAPMAAPMCMDVEKRSNPKVKNQYRKINSIWSVSDGDNIVGVRVKDGDKQISTRPDYEKGQQITLRAVARYTEVQEDCNPNILYKSIYLEVQSKELGDSLPSKPLPSTDPSDK